MRLRSRITASLAAAALATFTSAFASSPARAGDVFDGTFVHVANGLVEYFSLTDTDGQVAGFIYSLSVDPSVAGGLKEVRVNVSGIANGGRVNFRQGQGAFSTTLGWVATPNGDGFDLEFQSNGGYLADNQFVRSSAGTVNADIARLRQAVASRIQSQFTAQQRAQVAANLTNAEVMLQTERSHRPQFLANIEAAKAAYSSAVDAAAAAQSEYNDRQNDVAAADATAQAAQDAAVTPDDHQHASDLRQLASEARERLSEARFKLDTAESNARTAASNTAPANGDLVRLDNHIAQLSQLIANCKAYLAKH